MMSRDRIFKKLGSPAKMPPWTILDVEQMKNGDILVFDILAVDRAPVWHKSLLSRVEDMQKLDVSSMKVKEHYPLAETEALLASRDTFSNFKTDGLIFTPNTSYIFDESILLFKLQRPHEITLDFDKHHFTPGGFEFHAVGSDRFIFADDLTPIKAPAPHSSPSLTTTNMEYFRNQPISMEMERMEAYRLGARA